MNLINVIPLALAAIKALLELVSLIQKYMNQDFGEIIATLGKIDKDKMIDDQSVEDFLKIINETIEKMKTS